MLSPRRADVEKDGGLASTQRPVAVVRLAVGLRLDVNQHLRPAKLALDCGPELMRQSVGTIERSAVAELDMEVDVALGAGPAGAEPVIACLLYTSPSPRDRS